MATTPSHRHGGGQSAVTPKSHSKQRKEMGLWEDGTWWCDCDPRHKAALREVKKQGPNKGKFFWCCAVYPFCPFFLWHCDAKPRQTGPVSASASRPVREAPKTPSSVQRKLTSFGYSVSRRPPMSQADPVEASADSDGTGSEDEDISQVALDAIMEPSLSQPKSKKRKLDDIEDDDDDFFDNLAPEEERELSALLESRPAKQSRILPPESYATPETTRSVDIVDGLPTPSISRTLFPDSTAKKHRTVSFEDPLPKVTASEETAESSATIANEPPTNVPVEAVYDVTQDVMNLLQEQNLKPAVLDSLRQLLETAARKNKGLTLGRESARAALEEKNQKISELQGRIVALENKYKALDGQYHRMKENIMRTYQGA
jgi:chaperonin cofactor prefoldin